MECISEYNFIFQNRHSGRKKKVQEARAYKLGKQAQPGEIRSLDKRLVTSP